MADKKRILDHLTPADWITIVAIAMQFAVLKADMHAIRGEVSEIRTDLKEHVRDHATGAYKTAGCPADAARWPMLTFAALARAAP